MTTWRGDDASEPGRLADSLDRVARRMGVPRAPAMAALFGRWEQVVGPAAAAHSRPLRLRDGRLTVGCDHAAWLASLRHLEATIIVRLEEVVGAGVVDQIDLVVRPGEHRDVAPNR